MWINLDDKQIEVIKGAMLVLAEDEKHAATLFWTPETADTKAACLARARSYEGITNAIDEKVSSFDANDPYRAAAKEHATDDLEVDDDAVVSPGGDPGAWVQCWLWISDEEAGLPDSDEEEDDDGE